MIMPEKWQSLLPPPWNLWLTKTRLIPPTEQGVALLVIEESELILFNLYLLVLCFRIIQSEYSHLKVLLPVSGAIYHQSLEEFVQIKTVKSYYP